MKIQSLIVSNFRGIATVELTGLGNMVIIAGQNGSGKSCIFDAIRLLKSVYGGYQRNEWQQWMGEFQIKLTNNSSDFSSMFNDPQKDILIDCEFKLSDEERAYIASNGETLLRETVWRTILPEAYEWGGYRMAVFAVQFREREPEVAARVAVLMPTLMSELAAPSIRGTCIIPAGQIPRIIPSQALSVIFSTFRPSEIGLIDYHGAQRHYGRESVQGINLDLDALQQQRSQNVLYNSGAKYNNVKSEMAAAFVKELLADKAGVPFNQQSSLTNTLKELFSTFFPEKDFLGPQATVQGGLSFPVLTKYGARHDLDELSAGEKEILYGYLRIRNSAPRHSIILLDEPELHLNPRLIRGLPQFYQKNLGEALGNQMWLVTHSDALLREVVGKINYNVFHMLPCGNVSPGESQIKPLLATADLDLVLVDLVGDLAAYKPGGKVIIFEGGGDSDFDQKVVSALFPEILDKANLISGSNKARVKALHAVLNNAYDKGHLPFKFFSITDRDSQFGDVQSSAVNQYEWNVYHIENYFLEPKYISNVLSDLGYPTHLSDEEIFDDLRECARETLSHLLRHELGEYANAALVKAIDVGTDPKKEDLVAEISAAVQRSIRRVSELEENSLAEEKLKEIEKKARGRYSSSLADGTWTNTFRGRDILRRFVGKRAPASVSYEVFLNLCLASMKKSGFQPAGMKGILYKILEL